MTPFKNGKPRLTAIAARIKEALLVNGNGLEENAAKSKEPEGANGEEELVLGSPASEIVESELVELEVRRGRNLGIPVEETVGIVSGFEELCLVVVGAPVEAVVPSA